MQTNKQKVALYVHVPFCKQRCKYCTFVSCCDYNLAPSYFDALCNEIATKSRQDVVVKSIFFGGGTPSSVDEFYLQKVFDTIYQNYQIDSKCEVTVECNPESLTQQKIKFFVRAARNAYFSSAGCGLRSGKVLFKYASINSPGRALYSAYHIEPSSTSPSSPTSGF